MFQRRFTALAATALAVALLAGACTDDATVEGSAGTGSTTASDGAPTDGDNGTTDLASGRLVLTSALNTATSCDALLTELRAEGAERVGPYGFGQGGMIAFDGEDAMASLDREGDATETTPAMAADESQAQQASGGGEAGYSTTNVQEEGVDEADRVKTDGNRIVTVTNGALQVVDVTGDKPRLERSIELPENAWEGELFLVGDMALVVSTGWTEDPLTDAARLIWYPGSPLTTINEIDLNNGEVRRTLEFEGNYLSAREIDGSVRIALTAPADRFEFLYPSNEGAADQATEANRRVIEESVLEQWLPSYRLTEGDTTVDEGLIVDCDRVHLPGEFAGFGSLVVLTADAEQGLVLSDALSVFTDANTMYASTDRLVVATPMAPEYNLETGEILPNESYETALHSFDITDPARTEYVASGAVEGHLLSRYSLSEHEGYLRVAATRGTPWDSRGSESFVTVLSEQGSALETVGEVGGLGKGENIFAVRFLGEVGYVVTFRQVDPLYVIDLSDPTEPVMVGELKIPGFSSYLHPLGDGRLLGVGTDGNDEGETGGAVVSMFDVSDPTAPVLVDKLALGEGSAEIGRGFEGNSQSEVANDPRAFTLWDDTAFIPVSWWSWNETDQQESQGAAVDLIDVSTTTLTKTGSISAPRVRQCEGPDGLEILPLDEGETDSEGDAEAELAPMPPEKEQYCWVSQPQIQRTVVIDDTVYSVAREGMVATGLDSLGTSEWLPFPTER